MPETDPSDPPGILPDDLPKRGLFSEPLEVVRVTVRGPEDLGDDRVRVAFKATVRDAVGRRCPDLAVEARIEGPERTGQGLGWTDLLGAVEFRMEGPRGAYRFAIVDVAGGALEIDHEASQLTAAVNT